MGPTRGTYLYRPPADYSGPVLSASQQEQLLDPKGLRLLDGTVRYYSNLYRHMADEIASAAYLGACRAALGFDASKGFAWTTFLIWRVKAEIHYAISRATKPIGYRSHDVPWDQIPRTVSADVVASNASEPGADGHTATIAESKPADELPIGWEIESEDEVRKLADAVGAGGPARRESPTQRASILYEFLEAESAATPSHGRPGHSRRRMAKSQAILKLRYRLRYC
jgi:hypothetical protein